MGCRLEISQKECPPTIPQSQSRTGALHWPQRVQISDALLHIELDACQARCLSSLAHAIESHPPYDGEDSITHLELGLSTPIRADETPRRVENSAVTSMYADPEEETNLG